MNPALRRFGLCASLLLGVAVRAETKLAATSPFLPPEGAGGAGAAENTPLELRGILRDDEGYRFSIFDPVKKSGQWVRLNEPGHDFVVRTHDVSRDAVTLDFQGRTLNLTLRSAKVVGLTPSRTMMSGVDARSPGGPVPANGAPGVGPIPKPSTPEEQARFNRAVEEINRRRAARERGVTPVPK